jgi:hypothetical protein
MAMHSGVIDKLTLRTERLLAVRISFLSTVDTMFLYCVAGQELITH